MSIKNTIKTILQLTHEKTYIPVANIIPAEQSLTGKVALIAGGSGGIGMAIAKSFLQCGCSVILCGTNNNKLKACAEQLADSNKVKTLYLNLAEMESAKSSINKAADLFGKIDIFVNSAGVHTENVDFWTMSPTEWDRVMNINLKGAFFYSQAIGAYMKHNKIRGRIILISSSRGSEPAWSPYGISKWGLNGFTKGLAEILSHDGITVNCVAPGSTATPLIGVKEGDNIWSRENNNNRLIMPNEVASLVQFLATDAAAMITGEIVRISGGRGSFDIR
ncbi:SDR family NAD(P)-dependent oxidoreductase [Bifidobacterium felsineum]|uniref:Short-chain dehydrogenase n=1 Tax=Bifidobacterium felsineum TaxID=2045440 RepID=A0A2M9HHU6_9BIFI|nr:SDR family oxidoreductase [Bifidobacterium felsineum]PJM76400.1 short-chain dehydrogenase [Bifidobacterium felsineum]